MNILLYSGYLKFLSTLSLRRATVFNLFANPGSTISIHALLAESDLRVLPFFVVGRYFYPRSPCGERRYIRSIRKSTTSNFYPRSPCGERLTIVLYDTSSLIFLSTLSLRRATASLT